MALEVPVVLIASVSRGERRLVEACLKRTGFDLLAVDAAADASAELTARGAAPAALVIDAGLLEARHDGQWRQLRTRHPALGAVIRCLMPRADGSLRSDDRTFRVPPDDDAGLRQAVEALVARPGR
jgi:hypothetical protein